MNKVLSFSLFPFGIEQYQASISTPFRATSIRLWSPIPRLLSSLYEAPFDGLLCTHTLRQSVVSVVPFRCPSRRPFRRSRSSSVSLKIKSRFASSVRSRTSVIPVSSPYSTRYWRHKIPRTLAGFSRLTVAVKLWLNCYLWKWNIHHHLSISRTTSLSMKLMLVMLIASVTPSGSSAIFHWTQLETHWQLRHP